MIAVLQGLALGVAVGAVFALFRLQPPAPEGGRVTPALRSLMG